MFYIPLKSKMAEQVAKIDIYLLCIGYSCITLWVQNLLKITLSLTVSEMKNPRWPPKVVKIKFFPLCIGY